MPQPQPVAQQQEQQQATMQRQAAQAVVDVSTPAALRKPAPAAHVDVSTPHVSCDKRALRRGLLVCLQALCMSRCPSSDATAKLLPVQDGWSPMADVQLGTLSISHVTSAHC